jgi:hypothetical protein
MKNLLAVRVKPTFPQFLFNDAAILHGSTNIFALYGLPLKMLREKNYFTHQRKLLDIL